MLLTAFWGRHAAFLKRGLYFLAKSLNFGEELTSEAEANAVASESGTVHGTGRRKRCSALTLDQLETYVDTM